MFTAITSRTVSSHRAPRTGLFARLLQADANWRAARHLGELSDTALDDMGLTRADADRAFLGRWARA